MHPPLLCDVSDFQVKFWMSGEGAETLEASG